MPLRYNTVDREGATTSFTYDSLKRRTSSSFNSITTSNILDAAGNAVKTIRIGSDNSQMTWSQSAFDAAGRLTSQTNALNIGNRTSTKSGGDSSGYLSASATYGANNLNQYTNRTVPGQVDIIGIANAQQLIL